MDESPRSFARYAEALGIETFSVVLGILLALGANAWHDARVHHEQARAALSAIRAEVVTNRDLVVKHADYHHAMSDSMRALIRRNKDRPLPDGVSGAIAGWQGLEPTQLLDNAWQTARATQAIDYVPYDIAMGLSTTYAYQQRIADVNRAFYSVSYQPEFVRAAPGVLQSYLYYFVDAAANERDLANRYAVQLRTVDSLLDGER